MMCPIILKIMCQIIQKCCKYKGYRIRSYLSIEMMGLIGAGNNPMVGMTVAVAVSIQEASENGKF